MGERIGTEPVIDRNAEENQNCLIYIDKEGYLSRAPMTHGGKQKTVSEMKEEVQKRNKGNKRIKEEKAKMRAHISELRKTEKKHAISGKYEFAKKVRGERLQAEKVFREYRTNKKNKIKAIEYLEKKITEEEDK